MKRSVSIIICTKDRAESLRLTLASLAAVEVPEGFQVELIVVDNGSVDGTRAVVQAASLGTTPARYVHEARKGVSVAKNTGVAASTGEWLLFSDDDLRFPRNWIAAMCAPLFDGTVDAVQGGIRIAPHLERPWLKGALRIWVAAVEDPVRAPEGLVGANMAIRRSALRDVGGFDPRLGPGASGFFDDTAVGWALTRAGRKIAYIPEVFVEHHFSKDRLGVRSYLDIARRMAVSYAVVSADRPAPQPAPSLADLCSQVPKLAARAVTQALRWAAGRGVDSGFVVRYYYFLRALELRRLQRSRPAAANILP